MGPSGIHLPDVLTIREIRAGQSTLSVYWQTTGSSRTKVVRFEANKGLATISIPPDCTSERPALAEGGHTRIAIHKPAPSGTLEITVRLRSAS
jgi:hypothetical protein